MKSTFTLLSFSLTTMLWSSPAHQPKPICTDVILPIRASANNTVFPPYPNSTAPNDLYQYLQTLHPDTLPVTLVSGTLNLSATYCEPSVKVRGREGTIQFLLHGLSSTKEYWSGMDFSHATFKGEYSWVYHAASQGYATLAIDNLGNGKSSRPDPVNVVQPPLQLSVLRNIISGLRAGSLPNIPQYDKVIMASHSYGSLLARLMAQIFPTNGADAYILTAASGNLTGIQQTIVNFHARSASVVDPRFRDLHPGYMSVAKGLASIADTIYGLKGTFEPEMLKTDAKSPHVFAVGEVASTKNPIPTNFTGPVMVLTGRQDQIACGNGNITSQVPDCGVGVDSSLYKYTKPLFPKASRFDVFVPDDTAHNINTHYSAPESFGAAHQWLANVGF